MIKMINIRNFIIIILCITIICMGVGFAYLSMKLNNYSADNKNYDVSITKVSAGTSTKGGSIAPTGNNTVINNDKTVAFSLTLNNPKDVLTYNVTIKNNGTIKAQIDNLIEVPDYTNNDASRSAIMPITIEHNNIVGQVLNPGEDITLTVKATYNDSLTPTSKNINYQISILTSEVN